LLFLYRPRQTWMRYPLPREPTQQEAYNRQLQESFAATRRVAPAQPGPEAAASEAGADPVAALKDLAQLRSSGALTEAEFAAAKTKVLGSGESAS
jgi:Short C-terminal domain